jgi:hypothetical protein
VLTDARCRLINPEARAAWDELTGIGIGATWRFRAAAPERMATDARDMSTPAAPSWLTRYLSGAKPRSTGTFARMTRA